MMRVKFYILVVVVCIVLSLLLAELIWSWDLPEWFKVWLIAT